jgi:hypothetical protein
LKKEREERIKRLAESGEPDTEAVGLLINSEEFAAARKLIDKLAGGPLMSDLVNRVDAKEALSLVKRGDIAGAQMLAGRLTKAAYILQAYPAIIEKCVAKRDEPCATNTVYRAAVQLKQADAAPPAPPPGVPASALPSGREFDPVVSSLCELARLVLPVNGPLAFQVLDEMVAAADAGEVDTGLGRTGFDPGIFKKLARADGQRALRAALSFKDPLRQVVSLAAVYQREAEELGAKTEAAR